MNLTLIMGRILPQAAAVNRAAATEKDGMMGDVIARSARRPLPKNYQLIYDIVAESGIGRHLTSLQIYAKARKRRPGIGFSTVYRGLERLRDLGLLSELHLPGADAATYEPAGPAHAHFRCTRCGGIEDVAYAIPARTLKSIALRHAFNIRSERVTFEGHCTACATPAGPG
ncbi:MAG TPA: transcriptional repressor [Candidatus Cybelea sp.]|nr:transcriptional repressor [Candidatus Cybelea sp.]